MTLLLAEPGGVCKIGRFEEDGDCAGGIHLFEERARWKKWHVLQPNGLRFIWAYHPESQEKAVRLVMILRIWIQYQILVICYNKIGSLK